MAIFMTGATGFVGRSLLQRLAQAGERVLCMVRAPNPADARSRLERAVSTIGMDRQALDDHAEVYVGALDLPNLGLSSADRERIVANCDQVLHCGSDVHFNLPLARARAINVDGTRAL